MHEFWYDYLKPKYKYNKNVVTWICYMDTNSLFVHVKTEDISKEKKV